jgi:hypothetical protein
MNHLKQLVNDSAHGQVEEMIHGLSWQFGRRYGGDHDEWVSAANEAFTDAMETHDPDRSRLTTWIYRRVKEALQERVRMLARERVRADQEAVERMTSRDRPGLEGLLREVGEDAKVVLRVLISLPEDLRRMLPRFALRRRLREILWRRASPRGMSNERIDAAFAELEEAVA